MAEVEYLVQLDSYGNRPGVTQERQIWIRPVVRGGGHPLLVSARRRSKLIDPRTGGIDERVERNVRARYFQLQRSRVGTKTVECVGEGLGETGVVGRFRLFAGPNHPGTPIEADSALRPVRPRGLTGAAQVKQEECVGPLWVIDVDEVEPDLDVGVLMELTAGAHGMQPSARRRGDAVAEDVHDTGMVPGRLEEPVDFRTHFLGRQTVMTLQRVPRNGQRLAQCPNLLQEGEIDQRPLEFMDGKTYRPALEAPGFVGGLRHPVILDVRPTVALCGSGYWSPPVFRSTDTELGLGWATKKH
ncbi:hypothetical protein PV355_45375 [Streptomyces stelliscabiei]|uniref:hypothetical protein n=1 Tax=Streptomyces stelliscabiei TaxID=146820 RepID=UPI0029A24399|nr:hypothetical protein [Streptomyces stelliscabiei]MDX2522253.1 hypothetical protein [Streptomyces stelliscabiei]